MMAAPKSVAAILFFIIIVLLALSASPTAAAPSSLLASVFGGGSGEPAGKKTVVAKIGTANAQDKSVLVTVAFDKIRSLPEERYLVLRSAPREGSPHEVLAGLILELVSGAILSLVTDRRFLVTPPHAGMPDLASLLELPKDWTAPAQLACDIELVAEAPDFYKKLQTGGLNKAFPQRTVCITASRGVAFSDYLRHNSQYASVLNTLFEHRIFRTVAGAILRPSAQVRERAARTLVAHKGAFVGLHFPDGEEALATRLLQCAQAVAEKSKGDDSSILPKIFIGGSSRASVGVAAQRLDKGAFFSRADLDDMSFAAVLAELLTLTHAEELVVLEASRFSQLAGALAEKSVYAASLTRCSVLTCPLPIVGSGCKTMGQRKRVGMLVMATGKYLSFVLRQVRSANRFFLLDSDVTYYVFSDQAEFPHSNKKYDNIVLIKHEGLKWPQATLLRFHVYLQHWDELAGNDYLFALDADMEWVSLVQEEDLFGDVVAALHPGFYLKSHDEIASTYENNPQSSAFVEYHERTSYFAGGFYGGRSERVRDVLSGCKNLVEADQKWGYIAVWHDESYLNRYFKSNPPTRIVTPEFVYPEPPVDTNFLNLFSPVRIRPKLYALNKDHNEVRDLPPEEFAPGVETFVEEAPGGEGAEKGFFERLWDAVVPSAVNVEAHEAKEQVESEEAKEVRDEEVREVREVREARDEEGREELREEIREEVREEAREEVKEEEAKEEVKEEGLKEEVKEEAKEVAHEVAKEEKVKEEAKEVANEEAKEEIPEA